MEIMINTWYNCDIDHSGRFELCKICRSSDPLAGWHILTYYDGKEITSGAYKWEHTNVWGFPYNMKCDALNSKHYWIKNGKQLCRVIKAKFTNLQLENTIGEYAEISMIWGFPHIIEFNMYNTLMVVEKRFDTVKELKEDMKTFSSISDMDFTSFCNDIFADG